MVSNRLLAKRSTNTFHMFLTCHRKNALCVEKIRITQPLLNLNTFEVLYIEINRYDDNGQLIEETAGYMQMHSMSNGESYVHSSDNPDRGLSNIQIQGDRKPVDAKAIQSFLCQTCLDKINDMYFGDNPPEEYAVVNFSDKSIRPLIKNTTWFTFGNFDVDCDFEDNGNIDLLIHYCPPRYKD